MVSLSVPPFTVVYATLIYHLDHCGLCEADHPDTLDPPCPIDPHALCEVGGLLWSYLSVARRHHPTSRPGGE